MGTTVTTAERVREIKSGLGGVPPGKKGSNGNGSRGNGGGKRDDSAQAFSPKRHRLTMWIILAAVTMTFTALVSSYIALSSGSEWKPITIPRLLWLSTGLIIVSSVTFEVARRSLKWGDDAGYGRWLLLTFVFGMGFLVSQLLAWRRLVAQGVYLSSNNHSSFFYLLTGAHGVHLLGGLSALGYLLLKTRRWRRDASGGIKRQATTDAVSLYWHFMDGLWIVLFLLIVFWN